MGLPSRDRGERVAGPRKKPADVFLNVPYDQKFENLFLAYIAGVSAFGLAPRATIEIPGGLRRLDRIIDLVRECRYSIHDLSRVELEGKAPRTPRFNMPFELGLAVCWQRISKENHTWFVYESQARRLAKSLSDLNGTDPYIHDGRIRGVFRELCNSFIRRGRQPSTQDMRRIYGDLRKRLPSILRQAGTRSAYSARVFKELCVVASASAGLHVH